MCIKEEYKDFKRKDMSLDDFRKIVPYLKDVENVVLEGWGESLLHGHLTECISLARQQGTKVGFVTSGMRLDYEYAKRILDAGIGFIGFSLSGATPETHNSIRVNSDFDALINSIRNFKVLTGKYTTSCAPDIHIVYLMLKENIHELPAVIDIAKKIGIEEIVVLNIIQISNPSQYNKKIFSKNVEEKYRNLIKDASIKARQAHIKLVLPGITPGTVPVCSENPLKNIYISVEGEVSPCVFLCPPVPSPFKRIFSKEVCLVERVSFGNIFDEAFESIWNNDNYRDFRESFVKREMKYKQIYRDFLELKINQDMDIPHPPLPCRTCHKMLGV